MDEYRVVGPPGTGKTTYLAKQCKLAVKRYGSDRVMVCSLTKAAARTAAGRDTGVSDSMIGTLHALAYRAIGRPRLLDKTDLDEWNQNRPEFRIARGSIRSKSGLDDSRSDAADKRDSDQAEYRGSDLLADLDLARARRLAPDLRRSELIYFGDLWTNFKRDRDAIDFGDMIELAIERSSMAPGNPAVIMLDEAQDFSKLEMELVRIWAQRTSAFVVVGDPYQALYDWRGSDPTILDGQIQKVLDQSYRVPAKIQDVAVRVLQSVGCWNSGLAYKPKPGDPGQVISFGSNFMDPESINRFLNLAGPGQSSMIVASCDYMLAPIKKHLRESGILYHNPFTHRYNPISIEARNRLTSLCLMSREDLDPHFRSRPYQPDLEIFKLLIETISTRHLRNRLSRRLLRELRDPNPNSDPDTPMESDLLAEAVRRLRESVTPEAFEILCSGDILKISKLASGRVSSDGIEYLGSAIHRDGWIQSMDRKPRVILSTIHACKGGEADRVLVFPDLSPAGWKTYQDFQSWSGDQAVARMFYVACTRAKSELWIGESIGSREFPLMEIGL